jgi:hypothetical protein
MTSRGQGSFRWMQKCVEFSDIGSSRGHCHRTPKLNHLAWNTDVFLLKATLENHRQRSVQI